GHRAVVQPRSAVGSAGDGCDLGHHLAVDDRQARARRLLHADHMHRTAIQPVADVVADGPAALAQGDAFARLRFGAHAAGGAVRIAIGDVPGHGARTGGRAVDRAAAAVGAVHHLAADMAAVDPVADVAASHRAAHGRGLAAVAAA